MGLLNKLFGRANNKETKQPKFMDAKDILFTTPTVSNDFPPTTNTVKTADFNTFIFEDDWRQNEFLNFSSLPLIEIEIQGIKKIWDNDSKKIDEQFTAFTNCHVRQTIGDPNLEIRFEDLLNVLTDSRVGSLKVNDNFVLNGFSLSTGNTTFYGLVVNNVVTVLCISDWNDNTAMEILKLTKLFNLVFVNWYHCDLIRDDAE